MKPNHWFNLFFYLVCYIVPVVIAASAPPPHCVTRSHCGTDTMTGIATPCVYDGPPQRLTQKESVDTMLGLCPGIFPNATSPVCCDDDQVTDLANQIVPLNLFLGRCPSCATNVATYICNLVCGPTQSTFMKVTKSLPIDKKAKSVLEVDFYVTNAFTSGLFDSCSNVQMPEGNDPAINILCGDWGKRCSPHRWLQYMGHHGPSPFQVDFHFEDSPVERNGTTFYPLNPHATPCSQPATQGGTPCSCVDCPAVC